MEVKLLFFFTRSVIRQLTLPYWDPASRMATLSKLSAGRKPLPLTGSVVVVEIVLEPTLTSTASLDLLPTTGFGVDGVEDDRDLPDKKLMTCSESRMNHDEVEQKSGSSSSKQTIFK